MKRLVLSFAILLAACGGIEAGDPDDTEGAKPGKPRSGKPQLDGGSEDASPDAGAASGRDGGSPVDAGPGQGDTGSGQADSTVAAPDASQVTGAFEGRWNVTMVANDDTTCTNPASFEAQIVDVWQFEGAVLMGNHLGPNPYNRDPGSDVWNTGETTIVATADLELASATQMRGVFVFYRDLCDVFYDVTGVRAR